MAATGGLGAQNVFEQIFQKITAEEIAQAAIADKGVPMTITKDGQQITIHFKVKPPQQSGSDPLGNLARQFLALASTPNEQLKRKLIEEFYKQAQAESSSFVEKSGLKNARRRIAFVPRDRIQDYVTQTKKNPNPTNTPKYGPRDVNVFSNERLRTTITGIFDAWRTRNVVPPPPPPPPPHTPTPPPTIPAAAPSLSTSSHSKKKGPQTSHRRAFGEDVPPTELVTFREVLTPVAHTGGASSSTAAPALPIPGSVASPPAAAPSPHPSITPPTQPSSISISLAPSSAPSTGGVSPVPSPTPSAVEGPSGVLASRGVPSAAVPLMGPKNPQPESSASVVPQSPPPQTDPASSFAQGNAAALLNHFQPVFLTTHAIKPLQDFIGEQLANSSFQSLSPEELTKRARCLSQVMCSLVHSSPNSEADIMDGIASVVPGTIRWKWLHESAVPTEMQNQFLVDLRAQLVAAHKQTWPEQKEESRFFGEKINEFELTIPSPN